MCLKYNIADTKAFRKEHKDKGIKTITAWKIYRCFIAEGCLRSCTYYTFRCLQAGIVESDRAVKTPGRDPVDDTFRGPGCPINVQIRRGIHVYLEGPTGVSGRHGRRCKAEDEHVVKLIVPVQCKLSDLVAVGIQPNSSYGAVFMKVTLLEKDFKQSFRRAKLSANAYRRKIKGY